MDLDIEMGDVDEGAVNVQGFEELPRVDDILVSNISTLFCHVSTNNTRRQAIGRA